MQALLLPTLSAVMVKIPTLAHPVGGPGEELRIARSDESLTPFSLSQLLEQHPPESAQKIWRDAVPHKDAAGNIRHVLVKIGQQSRWGLVERISQESVLLAGMLSCDEDSTVLDLRAIVGYDLSDDICQRILDYLCGCETDWWENTPSMGALDVADKLGLERLLSAIVFPMTKERWESGRSYLTPFS